MDGGGVLGSDETFKLGDIGDVNEVNDLFSIGSAAVITANLAIALNKFGGIGGFTLNSYFDTFGLEGLLANTSWIVLLFQAARWLYTTFYTSGARGWSPFVFVCILLAVQIIHDLIFYYGLLESIPAGKNEMLDNLKKYAKENGRKALGTHSTYFILTAVIAMFLKEKSLLFSVVLVNIALYVLPFLLTFVGLRPPPPPPPKEKKETYGMPSWNGPRF